MAALKGVETTEEEDHYKGDDKDDPVLQNAKQVNHVPQQNGRRHQDRLRNAGSVEDVVGQCLLEIDLQKENTTSYETFLRLIHLRPHC